MLKAAKRLQLAGVGDFRRYCAEALFIKPVRAARS